MALVLAILAIIFLALGIFSRTKTGREFFKRKQYSCHSCGQLFKSFEWSVDRCPHCSSPKVQEWKGDIVKQPRRPTTWLGRR